MQIIYELDIMDYKFALHLHYSKFILCKCYGTFD